MSESKKIYIVMVGLGEYLDAQDYILKAFYNENSAKHLVKELSGKIDCVNLYQTIAKVEEEYEKILNLNISCYGYIKPNVYIEETLLF